MSAIRLTDKDLARVLKHSDCTIARAFGGDKPKKLLAHKNTPDGDFDSGEEYQRWCFLKIMQQAGLITDLEYHPKKYVLQEAFIDESGEKHRAITYTADFRYFDCIAKAYIVEDYKGWVRPEFRRTKKLLLERHPDLIFFVNTEIKGVWKP